MGQIAWSALAHRRDDFAAAGAVAHGQRAPKKPAQLAGKRRVGYRQPAEFNGTSVTLSDWPRAPTTATTFSKLR
jgi:hypothetical protein